MKIATLNRNVEVDGTILVKGTDVTYTKKLKHFTSVEVLGLKRMFYTCDLENFRTIKTNK